MKPSDVYATVAGVLALGTVAALTWAAWTLSIAVPLKVAISTALWWGIFTLASRAAERA